jgi:transposase
VELAAGRGGRFFLGALCPRTSLAPGTCVDLVDGASASSFERLLSYRVPAPAAFSNNTTRIMEKAMPPRKRSTRLPAVPNVSADLVQVHNHAAGIDVHSKEHYVAVPVGSPPADAVNPEPNLPPYVRIFGTNTRDLEQLATWLRQCGVTTVALQATGVYHLPLVDVLEKHGFEVIIADPRQTTHAPGRPKTDVLECQWIQRLHSYGLLRASFVPGPEILKLRSYQRQRDMLVRYAAAHIQHMQKALELMNCKLTEVLADVVGVTGMLIIKAIVRGERDPQKLASYRRNNCHATLEEIAAALEGTWQEDYLFELKQALKLYEEYQRRLKDCEEQIEACLKNFADKSEGRPLARTPRRGRNKNAVAFDMRTLLLKMAGVDVTVIEGIDDTTALVLLSEIGPDLSAFPATQNFTSWLGLSPNHRGSGGKVRHRRVKLSASRANRAFRLAASGCHHAHNALGAFYRRLAARIGSAKALVATARKIAERFYTLLTKKETYERQAEGQYEETYRRKLTKGLAKRAQELGYQLVPLATATATT